MPVSATSRTCSSAVQGNASERRCQTSLNHGAMGSMWRREGRERHLIQLHEDRGCRLYLPRLWHPGSCTWRAPPVVYPEAMSQGPRARCRAYHLVRSRRIPSDGLWLGMWIAWGLQTWGSRFRGLLIAVRFISGGHTFFNHGHGFVHGGDFHGHRPFHGPTNFATVARRGLTIAPTVAPPRRARGAGGHSRQRYLKRISTTAAWQTSTPSAVSPQHRWEGNAWRFSLGAACAVASGSMRVVFSGAEACVRGGEAKQVHQEAK